MRRDRSRKDAARGAGVIELPTAKDLGFIWDRELVIAPGEAAAQARLEDLAIALLMKERATSHLLTAHPN